jgi:hypothetical protein
LTIILSSFSSCFYHSSPLPLIPFSHQSSNPFRPGKFRSTSFSSSRWTPFHNFFRQSSLFHSLDVSIPLKLLFYDYCKWRSKEEADKGPCGLSSLPFCFIDCSNPAQGVNINLRLYVLFIFYRRQAYSDLASKDYKCIKDSVIQKQIMNLTNQRTQSFEAERSTVCSFYPTNIFCQFPLVFRACL